MTKDVETRLEGQTLVVRIPMRFQRRGGRKRIVAPDGSETVGAAEFEAWLNRLTGLDHAGRTVS